MKQFYFDYTLTATEQVARGSTRGSTQDVPVFGPTRWCGSDDLNFPFPTFYFTFVFAQDAALLAAVTEHKAEGWAVVAEHMDGRATGNQCANRWHSHVQPLQRVHRVGAVWTGEELQMLEQLVHKHTVEPHWSDGIKSMTQQRTDWTAVVKELNRMPKECCDKWQPIAFAKKTNTFTARDDALILRREKEWGNKGVGLWASLEKKLKRPERNIRRR